MTIKLTKAKNIIGAYRSVGEVISLPELAEQALIRDGYAEALPSKDYTTQSDTLWANNSVNPKIEMLPAYRTSTTTANTITRHTAYWIKNFQFNAFSIRLFNAHSATVDYNCCILTTDALGDGLYSDSPDWQDVTFSGSTTVTVPATSGENEPGFVDSDIIYLQSKQYNTDTVFAVRTYAADDTTRLQAQNCTGTDIEAQTFFACHQAVNAVADPALLVSPTFSAYLASAIPTFYTQDPVRSVVVIGGSVVSGQGDSEKMGHLWRAQQGLCEIGKPTFFQNYCVGTRTSDESLDLALSLIDGGYICDDMVLLSSSSDDSLDPTWGTDEYVGKIKAQSLLFISACRKARIRPWILTTTLSTGMIDPEYSTRRDCNRMVRVLGGLDPLTGLPNGTRKNCGVVDMGIIFSDESASSGTWLDESDTGAGVHMSTSGNAKSAAYLISLFGNTDSFNV